MKDEEEELAAERAENLVRMAKDRALDIISQAEKRGLEIVEFSKTAAKEEADRVLELAREEIQSEVIRQGVDKTPRIVRMIEFAPEHKQAGISILSYFADIIQQKYPNSEANVRIEQIGTKVKLIIQTTSGLEETIEHALEQYGQVIHGSLSAKEFLPNDIHALKLNNKLEIAKLELRMTQTLMDNLQENASARIESLEREVTKLHEVIASSFLQLGCTIDLLQQLSQRLRGDETALKALSIVKGCLQKKPSDLDKKSVITALKTLQKRKPEALTELYDFLKSTASGTAGSVIASWIAALTSGLPK